MAENERRDWKAIAAAIRALRRKRTQGQFGRDVGLSQGQVSELENAAMRRLSDTVLDALRKILPEALLTEEVAHGVHPSHLNALPPESGHSPDLPRMLGRRLTDREKAVIYPLVAAMLDLWRLDDAHFEHLLRQTGILLKASGRDSHPSIELALKVFQAAGARAGTTQKRKRR